MPSTSQITGSGLVPNSRLLDDLGVSDTPVGDLGVHSRQRGPLEGFGAPFLNYERAMLAEAGAGTASYPSPIFSAGGLFLLFASN